MGTLAEAIEAAEQRKEAVLGEEAVGLPGIAFTNESETRALLSGWDIDFEEFVEISQRAGMFFAKCALVASTPETCRAAWTDGFLIGLLLASKER